MAHVFLGNVMAHVFLDNVMAHVFLDNVMAHVFLGNVMAHVFVDNVMATCIFGQCNGHMYFCIQNFVFAGKPLSKCGKCKRFMKLISSRPTRLFWCVLDACFDKGQRVCMVKDLCNFAGLYLHDADACSESGKR
jgi:hypothetical protein